MFYPTHYSLNGFAHWAQNQGTVYWNGYNQCVALVEAWCHNLLKAPIACTYAFQMFQAAPASQWIRIANAPNKQPRDGDIVVWRERPGSAGHVAVAFSNGTTLTTIHSLDQNWSRYHRVTQENHHYAPENIVGWLRPR